MQNLGFSWENIRNNQQVRVTAILMVMGSSGKVSPCMRDNLILVSIVVFGELLRNTLQRMTSSSSVTVGKFYVCPGLEASFSC